MRDLRRFPSQAKAQSVEKGHRDGLFVCSAMAGGEAELQTPRGCGSLQELIPPRLLMLTGCSGLMFPAGYTQPHTHQRCAHTPVSPVPGPPKNTRPDDLWSPFQYLTLGPPLVPRAERAPSSQTVPVKGGMKEMGQGISCRAQPGMDTDHRLFTRGQLFRAISFSFLMAVLPQSSWCHPLPSCAPFPDTPWQVLDSPQQPFVVLHHESQAMRNPHPQLGGHPGRLHH